MAHHKVRPHSHGGRLEILTPPHVEYQPDIPTLGITVTTPFRGMLAVRDQLLAELIEWLNQTRIGACGPYFLRLHTIDMNGPMKLEVGIRDLSHPGDHRVKPGTMPAGQYASMTYRNHALRANRALLAWITDQGLVPDRNEVPDGDHFGCRYEAYLTDPDINHAKLSGTSNWRSACKTQDPDYRPAPRAKSRHCDQTLH